MQHPTRSTTHPDGPGTARILTTPVGLRIPGQLPFPSWERAGAQLVRAVDSFAWCLGDWLVFGQQRFPDRYRVAVANVGLDYQTLRNYASVARRVTMPLRRPGLSFQHHAEVAPLPEAEQDRWLARAEDSGWSRNQLRQHLRRVRGSARQEAATVSVTAVIPPVRVGTEQAERWRAAADRSSHLFEKWVVMALDHAAALALDQSVLAG